MGLLVLLEVCLSVLRPKQDSVSEISASVVSGGEKYHQKDSDGKQDVEHALMKPREQTAVDKQKVSTACGNGEDEDIKQQGVHISSVTATGEAVLFLGQHGCKDRTAGGSCSSSFGSGSEQVEVSTAEASRLPEDVIVRLRAAV
jgi:hypothetical protein